jgi:glutamyl-tRNA synthetase
VADLITRLAPSPTGALHLGNARTFVVNWLLARQLGWRIILRVEDLDGPRIKRGAADQLLVDLKWLGLDWDEGPIYQSTHRDVYADAIERLLQSGNAYPCICTRSEVESAASAPHAEDGAALYPGSCRGRFATVEEATKIAGRPPAIRFRVPETSVEWTDRFAGQQRFEVARQLGDFVIAKADGTPAYQLAVVIDDAAAAVTHVVRGDDLLDSTPRQMLLYRALGLADRTPNYYHLPLVVGTDGRRLAKRHGDTRLSYYRESKVPSSRILSLLTKWCGIEAVDHIESAEQLLTQFDLSRLPRTRIVFDPATEGGLRLPL